MHPPPYETFEKMGNGQFCTVSGCNNVAYFSCDENQMTCGHVFKSCQKQVCPLHIHVGLRVQIINGKHSTTYKWNPTVCCCKECEPKMKAYVQAAGCTTCKYFCWFLLLFMATVALIPVSIIFWPPPRMG